MTTELQTAEAIRERLRELVAPMREQLELVQSEIAGLEARLVELRSIRTELNRAVRTITGEPATNVNGQPRKAPKKDKGSAGTVSMAKVDATLDWLLEHRELFPEGFTGKQLRQSAYDVYAGDSQVAASLKVLHDRGQLVLVRRSASGAKVYRLP